MIWALPGDSWGMIWALITRGQLGDDLGILRPLPRCLLRLRVGVVGPAVSRLVLKPHLSLAAGRGEGDTLWRE